MKPVHQVSTAADRAKAAVARINRDSRNSKRAMTAAGRALGMRGKAWGRIKPYTEIGISRVPCVRCGEPSAAQFQVCATRNQWCAVCRKCDLALNALVVKFMKLPNHLIDQYTGA